MTAARSGALWTVGGVVASRGTTFATTVVVARTLTPADVGNVALAGLVVGGVTAFGNAGLSNAVVVRRELSEHVLQGVFFVLVVYALFLAAVGALLAYPLTYLLGAPAASSLVVALSLALCFSSISWFYEALLARQLLFKQRFVAQVAQSVVYTAVVVTLLLVVGLGVWSVIVGTIAGSAAYAALCFLLAPERHRPRRRHVREVAPLLPESNGFLLQSATAFVDQNVDYATVVRLLGPTSLGLYSLSYRLAELPYLGLAGPVGQVLMPVLSRAEDAEAVRGTYLRALRLVSVATTWACALLAASAPYLVVALYGEAYSAAGLTLQIMALWGAVRVPQSLQGYLLNARGAARGMGRLTLVTLPASTVLLVLGALYYGLPGVAVAMVLGLVLTMVLQCRMADRATGLTVAMQYRALRGVTLAGVLSALVLAGLLLLVPDPPVVGFAGFVLLATVAYLAGLAALDRPLLRSVLAQAGALRRGTR